MTDASSNAPPAGEAGKFDRALSAYIAELARPEHTTTTLVGAVASTLPLPLAFTEDAIDGIDFLIRGGVNTSLVVYAIVREFEHFREQLNYPDPPRAGPEDG